MITLRHLDSREFARASYFTRPFCSIEWVITNVMIEFDCTEDDISFDDEIIMVCGQPVARSHMNHGSNQ